MTSTRAVVLLAFFGLAGCPPPGGPGPAGPGGVNPDGTPKWVNKGSGAYDGEYGKCFYGVGVLAGVQNPGLARQAVDNRARGEIAKIFDLYIAAMMKDYQRSTTAGDFKASAEEQDIVSAQKTITEVTLRGVEVRDHWTDPRDNTFYALAILDMNNIMKALNDAQQLNARVRDHVRANARRAFEDLDRELQKRTDRGSAQPAPAPEPAPAPAPVAEPAPAPAPAPVAAPRVRKVGVKILGHGAAKIQTCFVEQLTQRGYQVFEGTSDVDVMIHGNLKYAKAGEVAGSILVRADINLRVTSIRTGRTLAAWSEDIKVGRETLETSVQLAIYKLCTQVTPNLVQKFQGN